MEHRMRHREFSIAASRDRGGRPVNDFQRVHRGAAPGQLEIETGGCGRRAPTRIARAHALAFPEA
ncbi:hypothetical protein [Micromonospora sp. 4G55]|uniref:hypothetical protein n=1 Tax=Micromonospora sp. 4G55 TaxID=2806102 RepID=UPI001A3DD23A|nr:hypothetical protein [Micromonospora sp. 4G55]MBM0257428.1 hypothetical protein [Micromonospora sp. 4G55]